MKVMVLTVPTGESCERQNQCEIGFKTATNMSDNRGNFDNESEPHGSSSAPNVPVGVKKVASSVADKEQQVSEDNRFFLQKTIQKPLADFPVSKAENIVSILKPREREESFTSTGRADGGRNIVKLNAQHLNFFPFNSYPSGAGRCPTCHVFFQDHEALGEHTILIHRRNLVYGCAYCSTKVKTVVEFVFHLYISHGKLFLSNQQLLSSSNVKYSCTTTGAPTGHSMALLFDGAQVQHNSQRKTIAIPTITMKNSVANKISVQNLTKFQCEWDGCERKFTSIRLCNLHYKDHSKINSYPCLYCENLYSTSRSLDRHVEAAHNSQIGSPKTNNGILGQKRRGKGVPTKETMPVNLLTDINSLNANYNAPKVPSSNNSSFQTRIHFHVNANMSECGKYNEYQQPQDSVDAVDEHNSVHEKVLQETVSDGRDDARNSNENCRHRGQEIENARNPSSVLRNASIARPRLASQLRTAKKRPHQCPWEGCTGKFTRKNALKDHLKTHTGEKPYQCDWKGCTREFAQKSTLRRHMKTHTGEKPFQCVVCLESFGRSEHLTKHTNKYHE